MVFRRSYLVPVAALLLVTACGNQRGTCDSSALTPPACHVSWTKSACDEAGARFISLPADEGLEYCRSKGFTWAVSGTDKDGKYVRVESDAGKDVAREIVEKGGGVSFLKPVEHAK